MFKALGFPNMQLKLFVCTLGNFPGWNAGKFMSRGNAYKTSAVMNSHETVC